MQIETLEDVPAFAQRAADLICAAASGASAVAALPSGATPVPVYAELVRRARAGDAGLAGATACTVDELYGVPSDHPATNATYLRLHLDVPLRALHVFDSNAPDPDAECARITRLIEQLGGLDLAVLGIGANGHIAFNEPGSPFDSRARLVELQDSTREPYAEHFGSLDETPCRGLTLGIADLMAAREVLLLATGEGKADIVARALEGPVTHDVPASVLRRHPRLTVLLDPAAARRLRRARPA